MYVDNLIGIAVGSAEAGIRARQLLIAKSSIVTTRPPSHVGLLHSSVDVEGCGYCVRFLAVADSFVRYADTLRERGSPVDLALAGRDLRTQAAALRTLAFSDTGGRMYRAPAVSFTPWYDVQDLLANHDDNVVGRITTVSRSQGNTHIPRVRGLKTVMFERSFSYSSGGV